jgi:hypothetical protein
MVQVLPTELIVTEQLVVIKLRVIRLNQIPLMGQPGGIQPTLLTKLGETIQIKPRAGTPQLHLTRLLRPLLVIRPMEPLLVTKPMGPQVAIKLTGHQAATKLMAHLTMGLQVQTPPFLLQVIP